MHISLPVVILKVIHTGFGLELRLSGELTSNTIMPTHLVGTKVVTSELHLHCKSVRRFIYIFGGQKILTSFKKFSWGQI